MKTIALTAALLLAAPFAQAGTPEPIRTTQQFQQNFQTAAKLQEAQINRIKLRLATATARITKLEGTLACFQTNPIAVEQITDPKDGTLWLAVAQPGDPMVYVATIDKSCLDVS